MKYFRLWGDSLVQNSVLQAIRANKNINYFNFKRSGTDYFLTNDTGAYLYLTPEEFNDFLSGDYEHQHSLKEQLSEKSFVKAGNRENFINHTSHLVRQAKSYLMEGTQLHIFVLTSECNHKCLYCQASATSSNTGMSLTVARKAVDLAFQSPSRTLSFEFQGGEPLLQFETLKFIVDYTCEKNDEYHKDINFNIVSNLSILSDEQMQYLIDHNVHISTSLDGPKALQNKNRPSYGQPSFDSLQRNILKINEQYKKMGLLERVQAIQTTTKHSLPYAKEIIDEYLRMGLTQIFLRPVAPFGFAKTNWNEIGFNAQDYIAFYRDCFEYILQLNQSGHRIKEGYAALFLNKILGDKSVNYMELRSPCGGTIGQLAYHYNGSVYSCDEGRMLGESGDDSFKIGCVDEDYRSLISNAITKTVCISSCLEAIPGCSDCVYQPYCGTCPIYNYSSAGNVFANMSSNFKCQIHKGILDILFEKIKLNDRLINELFNDWAGLE